MAWVWITLALVLVSGGALFASLIMGMVSMNRFYRDPDTSITVNRSYLLRLLTSRTLPGASRPSREPRDPESHQ